jgi:cell pole-organizing protein PopZ
VDEKKTEMSLDEVLSSIKKMVMDEEPPVLELTDVISGDGSIVKASKNVETHQLGSGGKNPDMSSFLRLIQENADHHLENISSNTRLKEEIVESSEVGSEKIKAKKNEDAEAINCVVCSQISPPQNDSAVANVDIMDIDNNNTRGINDTIEGVLTQVMPEIATPIIQKWLDKNLQKIVQDKIEEEVRRLFGNSSFH